MTRFERIKEKAYFIWQFRQRNGLVFMDDGKGDYRQITDKDDWEEAEAELNNGE